MKLQKFLCTGPGGRRCPCCFPAPGSRARKLLYRRAKRLLKKDAQILEQKNT